MHDFLKTAGVMDEPEILRRLFFPRRELPDEAVSTEALELSVPVDRDIFVGCRFYPAGESGPAILYFHGNGEITADYDWVAPLYRKRNLNLFVADYRGYGKSNGTPGCAALVADCRPLFEGFVSFLRDRGHKGRLFVMGRSLGSAAAIEVAYCHQDRLKGLIVESGFAGETNQLDRLGVTHLFEHPERVVGFGNDLKIGEVRIPTLIIHGEWDDIIPAEEGKRLLELSAASSKSSLFVPNAGHNDLLDVALEEYMTAIESFCTSGS
jgi:fermentation-respiration switch protein FrsA (DUF1100 family)